MIELWELTLGDRFLHDGKLYVVEKVGAVTSDVQQVDGPQWWKMCNGTKVEKQR